MRGLSFRITSMLLTFILLGVTETFAQTYERTFSFTFTKEDIEISKSGEGYYVRPNKAEILWSYLDEAPNKPAFPYLRYYILLPDNYKVKSFNHSVEDEMWYDGEYTLNAVPLPIPTDEENMSKEDDSPYPLVIYPAEIICYEETLMDGYRTAHFLINPFTYHADIKKLGLATNMNLDITIEPVDKDEEVNRPKDPASVKSWVYNPEDVDMEAENWTPISISEFSITGTKWYVNSHNSNHYHGTYSNTLVSYGIDKDTIIGGNVWKRLCKDSEELGYLREMDEQVWFYPTNLEGRYPCKNGHPFMLYDFSLQKGDTVYWNYWQMGYTRVPTQEDHIYNDTMIVKDVRFEHGRKIIDFGYGSKWIEGVGETGFAFFDLWFPRLTNGSSSSETVFQVTSGGQTIYFNGEVLDPDAALWLKTGMTWTQNWDYIETSNGKYRQITLDKEIRPGTFTFNSTCIDHWFPLKHIQEFNGKVYTIDGDQNIDLCYDFTLQEGNSVSILSAYWWEDPLTPAPPVRKYNKSVVSVVDSVEYSGIMRKRIVLEGEYNDVWVEGIGSLTRVLPIDDYNFPTGIVFDSSRITCMNDNGKLLYLHPDFIDCTTPRIDNVPFFTKEYTHIQIDGSTILCTSPTAVKLEIYTMDAVKVGEAAFANGEASVKVKKTPATYLYIVTYPDGRRESGKVAVK